MTRREEDIEEAGYRSGRGIGASGNSCLSIFGNCDDFVTILSGIVLELKLALGDEGEVQIATESIGMAGESGNLVFEGMRDGASDARRAADNLGPVLEEGVNAVLYGAAFGVSFGVCFTGYVLGRLIPASSPLAAGARDGCVAARSAADGVVPRRRRTPTVEAKPAVSKDAVRRARGEVTATAIRITEDTSIAHV
jgi:hypothetical protein